MMQTRTSVTHPLHIDEVTIPNGSGKIGMTLFPGRRDHLSYRGEWARDLDADLDKIVGWKPDCILTLVEQHEFDQLGVPKFEDQVRARGLPLKILPIRDAGVPDDVFEQEWITAGWQVRRMLRNGGRILVHCRAGLGRTGTIAARLLVELGSEPEQAIRAVRAARRDTIQTVGQEQHVRDCAPVEDAKPAPRAVRARSNHSSSFAFTGAFER
jgi:protein-tyrosine phosphatase